MKTKRYTVVRTSIGDLFITADPDRILRIGTEQPHIATAMRNDTMPLLKASAEAIVQYLSGKRTIFPQSLPIRLLPFQRDVFTVVQHIPYGNTATSEEIARAIGKPHAVRAVETVCRANPYSIIVPTHRILVSHTNHSPSELLYFDEALRRLEKRHLDKAHKRG